MSLQKDGLQHRVPRLSFENSYHYQSISSQVVSDLLLQGFNQEILLLCSPNMVLKILYLYSSYDTFIKYIKQIAQVNIEAKEIFEGKQFLFIENKNFNKINLQLTQLNMFSMHSLLVDLDQFQQQPFLSEKKKVSILQLTKDNKIEIEKELQIIKQEKKSIINEIDKLKMLSLNALKQHEQLYQIKIMRLRSYKPTDSIFADKRQEAIKYAILVSQLQSKLPPNPRSEKQAFEKKIKVLSQKINQQYKYADCTLLDSWLSQLKRQYQNFMMEYQCKLSNYEKQIDYIQIQRRAVIKIYKSMRYYSTQFYLYRPISQQQFQNTKRDLQIQQNTNTRKLRKLQLREKNINQQTFYQKYLQKAMIPQLEHFKFLKLFIRGSFLRYSISAYQKEEIRQFMMVCMKIMEDTIKLEQLLLQSQQRFLTDIRLSNIVFLYLGTVFVKQFRQIVNIGVKQGLIIFEREKNQSQNIQKLIKKLLQQLAILQSREVKNLKQKMTIKKKKQLLNEKLKIQNQKLSSYHFTFSSNPYQLYQQFMHSIQSKISNLSSSQIRFIDILFGFFQCKVIRQCPPLAFLENSYVLVRSNSKVIEKLKLLKPAYFAYYFDSQNKTIICLFEEVLFVLKSYIKQDHNKLINYSKQLQSETKISAKYFDPYILGFKNLATQKQDQTLYRVFIENNNFYRKQQQAKQLFYQYYQGSNILKTIKSKKRELLGFLLGKRHDDSEDFFFVSHQIRQYYFIERVLQSMKFFNFYLLKDIKAKYQGLLSQYQNYFKAKDRK